jgi:GPH family glycoside/pentoside/hexuronide:cation symporter
MAILTGSLLFLVSALLVAAVNVYLFKDYFSKAAALSIVGLIQTGTTFLAIPLAMPLVKKFGKKEIASIGMLVAGLAYLLLYFMPNLGLTGFLVGTAVAMFGMGFFNIVIWAFVTDVIDYHELITGLREDGTVYSFYSFARKVGQAIAGGVGGFAIAAVGYTAALKIQTPKTLHGIYALATLVPAIIYLAVALILIFWYPLNKSRLAKMTTDLAERRKLQS